MNMVPIIQAPAGQGPKSSSNTMHNHRYNYPAPGMCKTSMRVGTCIVTMGTNNERVAKRNMCGKCTICAPVLYFDRHSAASISVVEIQKASTPHLGDLVINSWVMVGSYAREVRHNALHTKYSAIVFQRNTIILHFAPTRAVSTIHCRDNFLCEGSMLPILHPSPEKPWHTVQCTDVYQSGVLNVQICGNLPSKNLINCKLTSSMFTEYCFLLLKDSYTVSYQALVLF